VLSQHGLVSGLPIFPFVLDLKVQKEILKIL